MVISTDAEREKQNESINSETRELLQSDKDNYKNLQLTLNFMIKWMIPSYIINKNVSFTSIQPVVNVSSQCNKARKEI